MGQMREEGGRGCSSVLVVFIAVAAAFAPLASCSFTGNAVKSPEMIADMGTVEAHLCPVENCSEIFRKEVEKSTTVSCALYDLSDRAVMDALKEKDALLAIDQSTYFGWGTSVHTNGIMHDKFCVLDGVRVLTGSYNPTAMGEHHANNIVIIASAAIARNYQEEFDEIHKDIPQSRKRGVKNPVVNLSTGDGASVIIETYFCPEDHCESHILAAIKEAKSSVHFMTYAFTSDPIGDYLVSRKGALDIKGVFEKQQVSQWSEHQKMDDAGIPVKIDTRPYLMHHKVFIIDTKTVITGSFNPSRNADENNDENVVIIRDPGIAKEYEMEFSRLFEKNSEKNK